jgi:hypothetical protein
MVPTPESPTEPTRRRSLGLHTVGVAAVATLVLAGLGAAVITLKSNSEAVEQPLGVKPLGPTATNDWRIASRGVLIATRDDTRIVVRLIRRSEAETTPSLTANFDGSGGGDALLVTCTAAPQHWNVQVGEHQAVPLHCSTHVGAHIVQQMQFVSAGQQ